MALGSIWSPSYINTSTFILPLLLLLFYFASTSTLLPLLFDNSFAMGVSPSKTFGPDSARIVSKIVSNVDLSGNEAVSSSSQLLEEVVVGAGCFWGIELAFQRVPGVVKTMVGYAQGTKKDPTYEEVCSGTTHHSEVVQIVYDTTKVGLDELLVIFWDIHDPTTLNRQGNDVGSQYRSGIYYTKPEQLAIIKSSRDYKQQQLYNYGGRDDIVTEVEPLTKFYPAEKYHQKYLERGGQCAAKGDLSPIRCYG